VVYLLDLSSGLYRSSDGGQNWIDIWPSMKFNNNDFFNTGFITSDNNDPSTLYVSIQGSQDSPIARNFNVYKLSDADTATFGEPGSRGIRNISTHTGGKILRPGPLTIDTQGRLWLTQQQDSTNEVTAELFVMEDPTQDEAFTGVTSEAYRNSVITPSSIDVSTDGYIYVAQNGRGVVKIRLP